MKKGNDQIEQLVGQAHNIFSETSLHEVIDLDNESARDF